MRTYEDVKIALKKYKDELANEAGAKQPHWVIIGGNMCITKKVSSNTYILGKGDPAPMLKTNARKNLTKFQERCGDNIKLEMVNYTEWLNAEINECNQLISCMQRTLAGETPTPPPVDPLDPLDSFVPQQNVDGIKRPIIISCENCPLGVNTCMTCRFCLGVDTNVYPWEINCGFTKESC